MEERNQNVTEEIDLLELLASCYRRKFMIAFCFLVAVGLAIVYLLFAVPIYEASATIMVNPLSQSTSLTSLLTGDSFSSNKISNEIALMKSRINLSNALSKLDLSKYVNKDGIRYSDFETPISARQLSQKLSISNVKDTNIVSITVTDPSAEFATDFANALAESYNELLSSIARHSVQTSIDFLESQIPINQMEAEEASKALARFQAENNTLQVSQESKNALLNYNYLIKREAPLQLEADEADAALSIYTDQLRYDEVIKNSQVSKLCGDIEAYIREILAYDLLQLSSGALEAKASLNTSQQARYFNLNQGLENSKKTLSALISSFCTLDRSSSIIYGQAMCQKIVASIEISLLQEEALEYSQFLESVPEVERQLVTLQTQLQIYSEMSINLLKMLQEAKLKVSSISGNVNEIDKAVVPKNPISPKKIQILLLGALGGIMVGCLIAILMEYNDKSIYTVDDVKRILPNDVPFLGWLPMLNQKRNERYFGSSVIDKPSSFEAERYKHIASTLLFGREENKRIMSIVASDKNIGKTSIMVNISAALAQQGYKVLLVDGDLRLPSCESFFNIQKGGLGLVDAVVDRVDVKSCIIKPINSLDTLHILPCGTKPAIPSLVFTHKNFDVVIAELKELYDFILIDAPPILYASELINITKICTESIIVLRAGISQKNDLEELFETLKTTDAVIAGACLNAYIRERGASGSSYGYGYNSSSNDKSIVKRISIFTSRKNYYRSRYNRDLKYREKSSKRPKAPRIYPYIQENSIDKG